MDLAGWAALIALPFVGVTALYPVIRDRNRLSQVERLTKLIKEAGTELEHGGLTIGERTLLRTERRRHIEAIAVTSTVGGRRIEAVRAVGAWVLAIILALLQTWLVVVGQGTDWVFAVLVYAEAVLLAVFGSIEWGRRRRTVKSAAEVVRAAANGEMLSVTPLDADEGADASALAQQ